MSPAYVSSPAGNNPVQMLLRGEPGYAFGTKNNSLPTVLMQVTQVAITSNVATVNVTVREGNIPVIGSGAGPVTITGTSSNGGVFNVTNVALTNVNINAATGVGTITFALVNANISPTADSGQAYVTVVAVGDVFATGSSQSFACQEVPEGDTNEMTVTWSTVISGAPATAVVNLQAAINDVDSEYQTLDTSNSTTGEVRFYTGIRFRFFRLNISTASGGTSPTIVGKILV